MPLNARVAAALEHRRPGWLAWRAIVALALMAGFYLLALSLAAALLWLPWGLWRYLAVVNLHVWFFCVVGGVGLLWSLVPRVDHFTAPGPRLHEREHPA